MSPQHKTAPLVLVAEDDAHIRDLVVMRLAGAGYRTASAGDGLAAVRSIVERRPAALILDINMPHLSGFDVLKRLKADNLLQGLPVLMLTARGAAEDVRVALQLGAKDYLSKPFEDRQLLARVSRLLRPVQRPLSAPPVAVDAPKPALARTKPQPLSDALDDLDIESV